MKKTVLILYSRMYDTSALALKKHLSDSKKYNVIAISEKQYDNFWLLNTYMRYYKYTCRNWPFINNLLINMPSATVEKKKDSDGNEVNFKKSSEFFARYRKVENICMRYDADYVICTTKYTIKKATIAREKYGLQGKIFALVTDFELSNNYVNKFLDGYFVINEQIKESLIEKGVEAENIFVIDMPISEPQKQEEDLQELRKKFNIRNELPTITLVGGKYCSKYVYNALIDVAKFRDCNIMVLTNGNTAIYRKFKRWSKENECTPNIYFINNCKDLEELYQITDYLISAPTTAICYEAIVRNIPLILTDSINNVETKNSNYLVTNGYAYSGMSNERIKLAMAGYIKDKEVWKAHCGKYFGLNGCQQVLDILTMLDEDKNPNIIEEPQQEVDNENEHETLEDEHANEKKRKIFIRKK